MSTLNKAGWEVLDHTRSRAAGGRFAESDSDPVMQSLVASGLMTRIGGGWAKGEGYYGITELGRTEHRKFAEQPNKTSEGKPIQPLNPDFKAEVRATPREIRMGWRIIAVFALGVLLWAVFE